MIPVDTLIEKTSPILVTGGAGFIASHLVEALVEAGLNVTVVDNFITGSAENLKAVNKKINVIVGDLGDLLRLNRLNVADYMYIFHLAANPYIPPSVENPAYDLYQNLQNTFALLEALRKATQRPRLINASSAAVYGNPARLPIRETDPTVPISPYGVSKLAAERYVAVYSQLYDIPAISMRFFSVYGPRQRKQVVFDILRKLHANPREIEILGDGSQARDFAFVDDVVQAMLLGAKKAPGKGETYNVASGTTYTIKDLVNLWCEICGVAPEIKYTGHVRPGDAERWEVDLSKLQTLDYRPQTCLEEGLRSVRAWYDNVPK